MNLRRIIAAALLPVLLAACTGFTDQGAVDPGVAADDAAKYVPSDEPYREGSVHFARGEYGLAEHYFRDATERAPQDAASWIALAASYDRLSRFDLADRCYRTAIDLAGETALILNNQGYSYMLRGNQAAARAKFARANALEPGNPLVQNNIRLLDGGETLVRKKGAS
jgi:Flp pilus assembly protein TadD